jgi:hypothetical protein
MLFFDLSDCLYDCLFETISLANGVYFGNVKRVGVNFSDWLYQTAGSTWDRTEPVVHGLGIARSPDLGPQF